MRILLDIQPLQSSSARRGIGRYTLEFTRAVLQVAQERGDEIFLMLNSAHPIALPVVMQRLDNLVSREQIVFFHFQPAPELWAVSDVQQNQFFRESAIERLRPDIVHVCSLFEDQHVAPTTIKRFWHSIITTVTLYDLIPLLRAENYLPTKASKSDYRKRLDELTRADKILTISEYVMDEAVEALDILRDRYVSVGTASSFHYEGSDSRKRTNLVEENKKYIVVPSGEDPRKNMDGFLAAFASLNSETRSHLKVVFAGHMSLERIEELKITWRNAGGPDDTLIFTGYISDEDLATLYAGSRVVVFPSIHEGFGLPALEAMICGAAVIVAGNSSMREIVAIDEACFNPFDSEEMAQLILKAISDDHYHAVLKANARHRVDAFSWSNVARKAFETWESMFEEKNNSESLRTFKA